MPESLTDLIAAGHPRPEVEIPEAASQARSETHAALALLGRTPDHLRGAALSVMPIGVRHDLYGQRLAEQPDAKIRYWRLTGLGEATAKQLASILPPAMAEDQANAEIDRVVANARAGIASAEGKLRS